LDKGLEVWVNSARTRRKENFSSHEIDKFEGFGSVKALKEVGNVS
jgi:hypothetical protein